ncbi:proteoglycan 4 isoform X1 [Juglans microcarpa x Juglans regia]|uniref:proteoglycan 4 isoform X1 n=1 Tax=Juglans microcarpa x Juglans regia TaxID=2249226 RepID=UPI001B7EE940|nr:proteoglycan 4 isoform X1 [Juglans microcarpa x Juglans regia]
MAEQRQPFRFRLPWQSAPAAPPPPPPRPSSESQPPGPKIETQTPAQSSTASIQRPPFRPAGIASSVLPPTASQARVAQPQYPRSPTPSPTVASKPRSAPQTRAEAPSPSRAAPQTGASGSVPSSPSRTSQAQPASGTTSSPISRPSSPLADRRTSQPSSPSRPTAQVQPTGTTKLQPIQESSQPSAAATQPPSSLSEKEPKPVVSRLSTPPADRRTSRPSSPSRPVAQVQPDVTTKLKPIIQESSQPLAVATQPPSSLSEKEPKSVVSLPLSQEPQLNAAQVPSETISNSQNRTPIKTSSKLDGVTTRPTEASQTSPTQKLDSNAIGGDAKPKLEEREVGKEVVREIIEEKTNGSSYEDPTKKTITAAFQEKQKPKWEKEESFDRKESVVATSSIPKQVNIASSRHPKERRSSSTLTTQKPSVISNGEQLPLHEEVRRDISKYVQKLTTSQSDYKKPVSVITLSGENRGASMQLGLESTKRDEFVPIHRGYKLNSDESTEATTDGEGSSTDKRTRDPTPRENPPSRAYVNSNVQSVNNSILFDTSVTENNPGVRLVVSNKQEEPHKAEFNVTPADKLTYQPTVRRRCLRGLFMEPSDSDPDNPEKPRRHGCRFSCGENTFRVCLE